jgi:hypothetical protein
MTTSSAEFTNWPGAAVPEYKPCSSTDIDETPSIDPALTTSAASAQQARAKLGRLFGSKQIPVPELYGCSLSGSPVGTRRLGHEGVHERALWMFAINPQSSSGPRAR